MDMSGMSMATPSATSSGAMASSMSGMAGMAMGGGTSSCKISMLWNWYTIDSCFISTHWHITSHGMFAGSCIGVICLVIMLEFLRRLSKDYDRYIIRQFQRQTASEASYTRAQKATAVSTCCGSDQNENNNISPSEAHVPSCHPSSLATVTLRFRPTFVQQSIRALLHMVTFAVAYFIMLLAMYYNGYLIICIFIGAYLGAFIFTWESVSVGSSPAGTAANAGTVGAEGVTVCCG